MALTGAGYDTHLTVTTISIDEADPSKVLYIDEGCFDNPVDLRDKDQVIDNFIRVATTVNDAAFKHDKYLHDVGEDYRPFSILLGREDQKRFDEQLFYKQLFNIPECLQLQREDMWPVCRKLSRVFRASNLMLGSFGPSDPDFSPPDPEVSIAENKDFILFLNAKKAELDQGSDAALSDLVKFAKIRAYYRAEKDLKETLLCNTSCWDAGRALWPDYAERLDLQERYPIDAYLTWHPNIKKAFSDTYALLIGYPANYEYKSPAEKRSRFYEDPLRLMIWNQFDVARGRRREHEILIADDSFWRGSLSERFGQLGSRARKPEGYELEDAEFSLN